MEDLLFTIKDWFLQYRPEGSAMEKTLWVFWVIWVGLIFASVIRVIQFRIGLSREASATGDSVIDQSSAAVIVPIKGVTPSHTSDFFQSLFDLDYGQYRLIVTVESGDDPAAQWLIKQLGISLDNPIWVPSSKQDSGIRSVQLVVAGNTKGRGQKVHNQLAAFEQLTPEDKLVVFVDADITCPKDWLSKLAQPVIEKRVDINTTYRWLVPERATPANLIASVINSSVTTQGGHPRSNLPWGGSMLISRHAFDTMDVPQLLAGSLNDDLRLGKAAKKKGFKVGFSRNLVRPTPINFSWADFFEFGRRQYLQVKIFAPITYVMANVVFSIYILGLISTVSAIVNGYLFAWIPLLLGFALGQVRAGVRESVYRKLYSGEPDVYNKISKTAVIEHLFGPLYMLIHWCMILSTWFMDKITWGGIQYQVRDPQKTRVLKRSSTSSNVAIESIGKLVLPVGGAAAALGAAKGLADGPASSPAMAHAVSAAAGPKTAALESDSVAAEPIKSTSITLDRETPIPQVSDALGEPNSHAMGGREDEVLDESIDLDKTATSKTDSPSPSVATATAAVVATAGVVVTMSKIKKDGELPSVSGSAAVSAELDVDKAIPQSSTAEPAATGSNGAHSVAAVPWAKSATQRIGHGAQLPEKTLYVSPGSIRAYPTLTQSRQDKATAPKPSIYNSNSITPGRLAQIGKPDIRNGLSKLR